MDDINGCIYICDYNNPRIVKLSLDFELLGEFIGCEGIRYGHMAVVGDEVVVTDCTNNVVMVYTKDLKYVRQVGSYGDAPGQLLKIGGMSSDDDRNSVSMCSVMVVNSSFGQGKDGVKLNTPEGVCVVGQYVYITEERVVMLRVVMSRVQMVAVVVRLTVRLAMVQLVVRRILVTAVYWCSPLRGSM